VDIELVRYYDPEMAEPEFHPDFVPGGAQGLNLTITALTNTHISIKLRLRLFDAIVTPTILFGLITMPLTPSDLNQLDAIQHRMLRSLVGWVCLRDEP
jgi:hypothetical protein